MKKKALSLILSAAMALSLTIVPVSAVSVSNFSDVSSDSWYYDSVSYVAERDYMNGTSATTFEPNGNMTRAMFATVISRVAGAEVDNSAVSEFTDVESGKWYTGAIEWGVENDLLNGYGNGLFGTNNSITRQDICTLTQRFLNWYCEQNNCTLAVDPKVESFTDAASIADYAKEAVEFCRDAGLLTGYEDGSFRPLGTATRAEIAAVIERIEMAIESAEPAGPVVSYTDEDGNKATLAIKAGDVITVNPDGGSVTYDGTTHRDEFTITATEDGITLPNATRSGYRFDGWKVEKDANGAYIFTAQWTRTSSGGGGGNTGGDDDETYAIDYVIGASIQKDQGSKVTFKVVDEDSKYNCTVPLDNDGTQAIGTENYHVVFDSDGTYIEEESDDISLVSIAQDLSNSDNINKILIQIRDRVVNGERLFIKGTSSDGESVYIFNDITVDRVPVTDILIPNIDLSDETEVNKSEVLTDIAAAVNESAAITVSNMDVAKLLTKLDSEDDDYNDKEIAIINAVYDEIDGRDTETLYNNVVKIVGQDVVDRLGLEPTDVQGMIDDYLIKLDQIVKSSASGKSLVRVTANDTETTNSTAGGVEVKVNPVEVLINQYVGNDPDDPYTPAKDNLRRVMDYAGIEDTNQEQIIQALNKNNFFKLCDPRALFPEVSYTIPDDETGYTGYSLREGTEYANRLKKIIKAGDEARKSLLGEDNVLNEPSVGNMIDTLIKKAENNTENENVDKLIKKIRTNKELLVKLITKDEPTLMDILEYKNKINEGIGVDETITLSSEQIVNLINRVLNNIGETDLAEDSDLVQDLAGKLAGDYRITLSVDAYDCKN